MTDDDLNCTRCKIKYKNRPEMQEKLFEQKLCRETSTIHRFVSKTRHLMLGYPVVKFFTCPANLQDNHVFGLIKAHSMYENGIMPYAGGLLEQPAKFVEVMDLVHNLKESHKMEQEEILKKCKR